MEILRPAGRRRVWQEGRLIDSELGMLIYGEKQILVEILSKHVLPLYLPRMFELLKHFFISPDCWNRKCTFGNS